MTDEHTDNKDATKAKPKGAAPSGETSKKNSPPKDPSKMTFAEHFEELRTRLFRCVLSVVVLFVICYIFKDYIVEFILRPYEAYRDKMVAAGGRDPGALVFIGPTEGFIFYLNTSFMAALFFSAPVILYQMWLFIGAGLYSKEKKSIMRVVPFSVGLFLGGLAFGYAVLFPVGLSFLVSFPDPEILVASITVSKYCDLFFILILIMGFMFQAPLIMVVTTRVGLTTPALFSSKRRYFLLGAFICAAMFTPPDAVTQCLLAGPLLILFEVGIILSRRVVKKQRERDAARDSSSDSDLPATDKAG